MLGELKVGIERTIAQYCDVQVSRFTKTPGVGPAASPSGRTGPFEAG